MLAHRYSFTSDASDSVGAQDGLLFGNATVSGGQVSFDGDMNSYVELPSCMISSYDSVTLEAWASFGANAVWSRVYDFGHYNPAGDGGSRPYAFLCPHTGGNTTRVVLSDGTEAVLDFAPSLDGLSGLHIAVVYDPPSNTQLMYTNGVLALSASLNGKILANLDDLKCWLGRSMYAADNGLTGSIDEFRIYAGVLTPTQIAQDFAAGPGQVVLPPPVPAPPPLSFGLSGSDFTISWPTSYTGFTLKWSPVLGSGASWNTVGQTPVVVGQMYEVTVPVSGTSAAFYRLVK
jgi:hypothetical protein